MFVELVCFTIQLKLLINTRYLPFNDYRATYSTIPTRHVLQTISSPEELFIWLTVCLRRIYVVSVENSEARNSCCCTYKPFKRNICFTCCVISCFIFQTQHFKIINLNKVNELSLVYSYYYSSGANTIGYLNIYLEIRMKKRTKYYYFRIKTY